jgi:predicted SprT family Zn-dependent metalloprotease
MKDQLVIGGLNKSIQQHARTSTDWKHRDRADRAYFYFESVNAKLYESELPSVIIGFDDRLKKAGSYYHEADSVGLKHHFDIRSDLTELELVIATLHNAAHAYIDAYKSKGQWYHTKTFRYEMERWGIKVDTDGDVKSIIDPESFSSTLKKIGAEHVVPEILDYDPTDETKENEKIVDSVINKIKMQSITSSKPKASKTKMKKWSCACSPPTNVRCATNLTAMCLDCDSDFELQI